METKGDNFFLNESISVEHCVRSTWLPGNSGVTLQLSSR